VSEQYEVDAFVPKEHTTVCVENDSYFVEGGSYYFVVTAYSTEGEESDYSNEVLWEPQ